MTDKLAAKDGTTDAAREKAGITGRMAAGTISGAARIMVVAIAALVRISRGRDADRRKHYRERGERK